MPSQLHEALISLFRNLPELAPQLARESLHATLPRYTQARIEDADLTEVQPAAYRADLVVLLHDDDKPVFGIVLEVQLSTDKQKLLSWPVYAVTLRARKNCPVAVLVTTPHEQVARWAANPIALGGSNVFTPWVIGPAGIPEVVDPAQAARTPELAVLSAMAHGQSQDVDMALRIAAAAMSASLQLDPDRSVLYFDLIYASLSEAARQSLMTMDPAKYEFQSEFAKRYLLQGRAEGRAEGEIAGEARGRSETLVKLLTLKFGTLQDSVAQRIRGASVQELELWTERVLSERSVDDVLR